MFLDRIAPQPDLSDLLAEVAAASSRPRYAFMLLSLIAQKCRPDGSAGPLVRSGSALLPIRDWLSDTLGPMGARDPRRAALFARISDELAATGELPPEPEERQKLIMERVKDQVRVAGKCNLSRVVSELVKAGLLKRHYQGYRVDHHNRGAQRQAVYTLSGAARVLLNSPAHEATTQRQGTLPFG